MKLQSKLVNSDLLEQFARKFNSASVTSTAYTSKGGMPTILFTYYQRSSNEPVAKYYIYNSSAHVFIDLVHSIKYTDKEYLM